MTEQRKSTTTFLLKLMPLASNNSKWMPLAISLKGGVMDKSLWGWSLWSCCMMVIKDSI